MAQDRSERQVNALMQKMTLAEKLGQLTQYSAKKDGTFIRQIKAGGIGSFLNYTGAATINALQKIAVEKTRLKIPILFAHDVIHGYKTTFPIPLATAASWDPGLVERSEAVAAREAYADGIRWTFAPMVDIARDPRWGRIAEGAGEDPYLGSRMAEARVKGFQKPGPARVAACAKHYVGYGAAEGGRDYNTSEISEWTLREVYLPPFRAAVRAGVDTLMSAYNDLNGTPASANPFTLGTVLRKEWGFKGLVVSDWNSVGELVLHGIAADRAEAGALALRAGVDMDMWAGIYIKELMKLVRAGRVPVKLVDQAVRRVLRLKFQLGLFENPYVNESLAAREQLSRENMQAALRAALGSIVLLKNEKGLLPLKSPRRIAVVGPLADNAQDLLGPWSCQGRPENVIPVLKAVRERAGSGTAVLYARGCGITDPSDKGFREALAAARKSDVVIAVVGESAGMSGEANNRSDLNLPGRQLDLLKALAALKKPLVMVLMNGRPLSISWEAEHIPAILETWFLGSQAGPAIAQALFGDFNPGGKLPVSFPRSAGQVPIYYNHKNTGRPPEAAQNDPNGHFTNYQDLPWGPLYPFGHGLSYTRFKYSGLVVAPKNIKPSGRVKVSVTVRNAGKRAGDEVVQLYIRDRVGSKTRPVRELKGFQRVTLQPGEKKKVVFTLAPEHLGFWNDQMKFIVEPGCFNVWVGGSSEGGLEGSFQVR